MNSTRLELAPEGSEADAIIIAQKLPALEGNGQTDLSCGGCGEVVARNLTGQAIAATFRTPRRLLLQCTCGALNIIQDGAASA